MIDEVEAATVRQVFPWYDEGAGLGRIAKRLAAAGVPSPRHGKGWCVSKLRLLLRRPTYTGVRSFRRTATRYRKGGHEQIARDPAEWMERPCPGLAIVDRELFDRVQPRLEARAARFLRGRTGTLIGRPRGEDVNPAYLLSGLLTCMRCGAAIGPMKARGPARYTCNGYHRHGVTACGNGLRVNHQALETAVLDAVAARLEPDVVAEAIRGAVGLLNARQEGAKGRRAAIVAELGTIATRERRLLDALVDGDATAEAIRARLAEELAARDRLGAELTAIETAAPIDADAVVGDVEHRAADLRGLLRRHPAQARQVLRLVLGEGRFQCEPFDDATGRGYHVTAPGDYGRLFTIGDFHTRFARLRAMALTRSPARPARRQNSRARSIAPRWEK